MDDNTPSVQDAEIVEESPAEEASSEPTMSAAQADATVLTSLDELIKNYIQSIDKLRIEVKKHREMIQDGFQNDPVYHEHDEKAKEAVKQRNATKQQIMKQPAQMTLANKVKGMQSELKEKQLALSDYLLEYQRLSGANQIETNDGQVLEIVNSAKVVRTSSKAQ